MLPDTDRVHDGRVVCMLRLDMDPDGIGICCDKPHPPQQQQWWWRWQ
jgi:hypothetical protein